MDTFARNKLLVRIVIVLALLNVFSLGIFFWMTSHRGHRDDRTPGERGDVSDVLKKELKLSNAQVEQIKKLRSAFFEKEEVLATQIRSKRDSMNTFMFNKDTNEERIKALAQGVAENEYAMEMLRYEQAKAFKSICTPEQLDKFKSLVLEIRDYFRPDHRLLHK